MSNETFWPELALDRANIIERSGTEAPFTGELLDENRVGTYICARCSSPLYSSSSKFKSGCGWPSFDDELPGAINHLSDPDGRRVEIRCKRCDGHLGHVFRGERFTQKNTRHCVNSLSMRFHDGDLEEAFLGGGCFWGVEHYLQMMTGVITVESGYMGGKTISPNYEEVCTGDSGHAEVVKVTFDPSVITFEEVATRFFEIHDPTQVNRQGPDIGTQYRSAVFTTNNVQQAVTCDLLDKLRELGLVPATTVENAEIFWPAEPHHQNYYERTLQVPYCHAPVNRFKK